MAINYKKITFLSFISLCSISSTMLHLYLWSNDKSYDEFYQDFSENTKDLIRNSLPVLVLNDNNHNDTENIKDNNRVHKTFYKPGFIDFQALYKNYPEKTKEIDDIIAIASASKGKTVKELSKEFLEQKKYYYSLLVYAEDFSPKFYNDNYGRAIGFGYNITTQTHKLNREIFAYLGLSEAYEKYLKTKKFDIELTREQAIVVAFLLKEKKQKELINVLGKTYLSYHLLDNIKENILSYSYEEKGKKVFNSLPAQQREALVYHVYKVGAYNLQNYKKMLKSTIDFAKKQGDSDNIGKNISYKYKKDGKYYYDTRAQNIVTTMFYSASAFKDAIENNHFVNRYLDNKSENNHKLKNKLK